MLLALVDGMLDMKLIQHGKFRVNKDRFNPVEILNFVTSMFSLEAKMVKTKISCHTVKAEQLDQVFDHRGRY